MGSVLGCYRSRVSPCRPITRRGICLSDCLKTVLFSSSQPCRVSHSTAFFKRMEQNSCMLNEDCSKYNWPDYKQYTRLTEKGNYRLGGSYHRDVGIDTVK